MRWRARAALTGAGAAALVGLAPVPAQACSCPAVAVGEALDAGHAVAIVTRTDRGPGTEATFAVEKSIGAALPRRLTGEVDDGGGCRPPVPPGGVAALTFERRGGAWEPGRCLDLADTLRFADGGPEPAGGGRPVAVVAGAFGGSRLAALEGAGRVVGWDGLEGSAHLVAACPGGARVVAVGLPPRRNGEARPAELTVHQLPGLRTLRALPLPDVRRAGALRCADAGGERVEIVALGRTDAWRLVVAEGDHLRTAGPENHGPVAVAPDGFVAVTGRFTREPGVPLRLVRLSPDGSRETVTDLPGSHADLALSPDGRTAAVLLHDEASEELRTVDVRSGRTLASRVGQPDASLAWAGPGRLLVRGSSEGGWKAVRVFDRALAEVDRLPASPGYALAAVADAAVTYLGTRMTVTPADGERLVLEDLRLAGAQQVVGLPGRRFGPDAGDGSFEDPPGRLLLGITLSASTLAGAVALVGVAIRRRRAD